ncbi:type IV pilin protein [Acinetobacter sp.]|uniref:type IV pilin protein n=1 Tax=Acinetobacter sp. TaxID=472 RepID=UPI0028AE0919|nr:prepilin-type N-terminal cleavage/methylation domain-containing protein [Acinetobacter sp.]
MPNRRFKHSRGFTLIELMVVMLIIAIFAALAIAGYQEYARKAIAAQAQQEMQQLANLLEKNRARNFNYLGFSITPDPLILPVGATGSSIKYTITVRDGANTAQLLSDANAAGQSWILRAESSDPKNYSFLMTSAGTRCKNKTLANITATSITDATCGTDVTGREEW